MVEINLKKLACFLVLFLPLLTHASLYYSEEPDLLRAALASSKRAGFIGMRGKKADLFESNNELDEEDEPPFGSLKRGEFVGMRGKKMYGHNVLLGRSGFLNFPPFPLSSSHKKRRPEFLGMRGKKSGFVGMRGKKKDDFLEDEDASRNLQSFEERIRG